MLIIAGTVPVPGLPLTEGPGFLQGDTLTINGLDIPCGMGTAAMISSAAAVSAGLGCEPPVAIIAGDIGDAAGSRAIYARLAEGFNNTVPDVLALHYLQPIMGLMKKAVSSLPSGQSRPFLIADAGAMYAAKAAGIARNFDLFTPDLAEMKFLADPAAMHPAYISNYLLQSGDSKMEELIGLAYRSGNAPAMLLVKGSMDHIAVDGAVVSVVDDPDVPELEPVGGTGDTITGLVAGLVHAGYTPVKAAQAAARLNRLVGLYAGVRPDSPVHELIAQITPVLSSHPELLRTV